MKAGQVQMSQKKETAYVDIDDEITAIIDKVISAKSSIVALVLPKRAATLQSLVNMKLLKKSAESASKKIVLITGEKALLPLAGAAGVHVAATLQSKPRIPPLPNRTGDTIDAGVVGDEDKLPDRSSSIGALALSGDGSVDTIELDNNDSDVSDTDTEGMQKPNKRLKIPNFNAFRTRLFLGIGAALLLINGWYVLAVALPKAEVVVRTDTTAVSTSVVFTASPKATQLDASNSMIPSKLSEYKKTEVEKVAATGQKDLGTKASGTVTLKNCSAAEGNVTIPSGTGVSSGAFTFITQEAVTLDPSIFSGGGTCLSGTKSVSVTAQNPGDAYNLSPRSYAVAGFSGVQASGTAMSGGTSNIVKVVSDQDVESAKQKLLAKSQDSREEATRNLEQSGLLNIKDTFLAGDPSYSPTPGVGEVAAEVTVTQSITYSMVGVKQSDLEELLKLEATKHIDADKEVIRGYGVERALFRITERTSNGDIKLAVDSPVIVGPEVKEEDIKKLVAGKKKTQAIKAVEAGSKVKEVQITLQPFYVGSVPKAHKNITVKLEQLDNGTRDLNP